MEAPYADGLCMLLKSFSFSLLLLLAACSVPPRVDDTADTVNTADTGAGANVWTQTSLQSDLATTSASRWQHYPLPGKQSSEYAYARVDGRHVMAARANASASMLRQAVHIAPDDLGRVKFSWKVPELIAQADMALRDAEDSPVRIVLAFDGDRSTFSVKNAMLSELSHALTGEPLPYATLMYVWCNTRAPGSVIVNPRTDRIRKLVVESGGKNLNQWLDYERDIRADFEKAFGESPGALVGIGIMTDTDNTRSSARAWYGQLKLTSAPVKKKAGTSDLTRLSW